AAPAAPAASAAGAAGAAGAAAAAPSAGFLAPPVRGRAGPRGLPSRVPGAPAGLASPSALAGRGADGLRMVRVGFSSLGGIGAAAGCSLRGSTSPLYTQTL